MRAAQQHNGLVRLAFAALLIMGALFAPADAPACSRSDIDFYLSKGFTQDQIAQLCSGGGDSSNQYRGFGEAEEEAYRRGLQRREYDDDNEFLRTALDAGNVNLSSKYLEYTKGLCMRVIHNPDAEARRKLCPNVRFRVYLRGLDVEGYNKKYFVAGSREINISGKIKRRLVDKLKEYPLDVQQAIKRSFNSRKNKNSTAVPIADGVPVNRVLGVLKKRVSAANIAAKEKTRKAKRPAS